MDNTGTVEWISCYLPGFDWNALRYTCPGNWEKLLGACAQFVRSSRPNPISHQFNTEVKRCLMH